MIAWNTFFSFRGKKLSYNRIRYNNPTERAVEIPIGFDFLSSVKGSERVLEVGNVLSYYDNGISEQLGIKKRRIIDKFEVEMGVDNEDLMELPSFEKYDAIVSISTVEHIGQSVAPSGAYGESIGNRDLEAPLKAIAKIYDLLAVGGKALITVPFGKLTDFEWYIQFNDEYLNLLTDKYELPQEGVSLTYLQLRDRDSNNPIVKVFWEEVEAKEACKSEYNYPFPAANAIAVIELVKVSSNFNLRLNFKPTPLTYHPPYEKRKKLEESQLQLQELLVELEQYKAGLFDTKANVELISVHIPKAAGTSFLSVLNDVYGLEGVFCDNLNVPASQLYNPSDLAPQIRAIHGHFCLDKYHGFFPKAKRVIWLRNPITRLISNYFFWLSQETGVPRNMEFMGIVEFSEFPGIQNIGASYIGKHHKLTDFDFVGIYEFFEEDLEDLKNLLGWSIIKENFINKNPFFSYSEKIKTILDDAEIVKKIAENNRIDMELYQEALDLRAKRRNELGGFHQLLRIREKFQCKLQDTRTQFQQSQSQLEATQTELAQSQSQLEATQTELAQSQSQLEATQTELAQSQSQLEATQTELAQSQSQLEATQTELAQSQSQLEATQTELEQSQSQLEATQTELEQSQSQLEATQAELEQSQSQLEATQAELEQSQSQLEATQTELEQSQSQLEATQAELEQSQSQLEATQTELAQSQSQLEATQAELAQSQSQLEATQAELAQSQSQLEATQAELKQSQSQLHQITANFKRSQFQLTINLIELERLQSQFHQIQAQQSQFHQIQAQLQHSQLHLQIMREELKRSQFQLHQIFGELEQSQTHFEQQEATLKQTQEQLRQAERTLEQSQAQLHQKEGELETAQTLLYQAQREWERSQFRQNQAIEIDREGQTYYELLVGDAWYAYRQGNLKQMIQYLQQSLQHSPFSKTETVVNWLDSFSKWSIKNNEPFDLNSLTNTLEWQELTRRFLITKKVLVSFQN